MGNQPGMAGGGQRNIIIAVVVALVLLCCCCLGAAATYWLWFNGDALLESMGALLRAASLA